MLPLLIAAALAVGHLLAAGLAYELVGHAAEAGAIAALRGQDTADAVRAALPEWAGDRVEVHVEGRRVRVRLRPLSVIPGLADRLASAATADAGAAAASAIDPGPLEGRGPGTGHAGTAGGRGVGAPAVGTAAATEARSR